MDSIEQLLQMKTWAVVGATDNPEKFGYKILKLLRDCNYQVFAVNPGVKEVLGDTCYSSLRDLPIKPDAVDIVVPPRIAEQILAECNQLEITNIWLQPGADAKSVIELAQQYRMNVVFDACVIRELKKRRNENG